VRAAESCQLLMFGAEELERLKAADTSSFVALLILAVQSLSPLIRRFITLGLNRVWANAGETVFERGDPATSLYIIIR
jgi:lysophospholipid hydrolase